MTQGKRGVTIMKPVVFAAVTWGAASPAGCPAYRRSTMITRGDKARLLGR